MQVREEEWVLARHHYMERVVKRTNMSGNAALLEADGDDALVDDDTDHDAEDEWRDERITVA